MSFRIEKLQLKVKKINPKNKKRIKSYQKRIKIGLAANAANYKNNWYVCNDEYMLPTDDVNLLSSLLDRDADNLVEKEKSLFAESCNRFYMHGYKSKAIFKLAMKREQLYLNTFKTIFHNSLNKDQVFASEFTFAFCSYDLSVLQKIVFLPVFIGLDFISIQKLDSDFYVRMLNIYNINQIFDLLESKEFWSWFIKLKQLHGLCLVYYKSNSYTLYDFIIIFKMHLNIINCLVLKQKLESVLNDDFLDIINMTLADADNIIYKQFESDLLAVFKKAKDFNLIENKTSPTELDLIYPDNLKLVNNFVVADSLLNWKSFFSVAVCMKKEHLDINSILDMVINLKNEL